MDFGRGQPQVIGTLSVPYIDPGERRPQAIGTTAKPHVVILSDQRDLVPDDDQVPDIVVDPGGLNLNSKYHHRSYGGRGGGRFKYDCVQGLFGPLFFPILISKS